jgi:hypothetical protein
MTLNRLKHDTFNATLDLFTLRSCSWLNSLAFPAWARLALLAASSRVSMLALRAASSLASARCASVRRRDSAAAHSASEPKGDRRCLGHVWVMFGSCLAIDGKERTSDLEVSFDRFDDICPLHDLAFVALHTQPVSGKATTQTRGTHLGCMLQTSYALLNISKAEGRG